MRPRRWTAAATVELSGDESCEAGRRATGGGLQRAVDRLGAEDVPGSQACANPAALVDTAEGVLRLSQARRHTVNLQAEPAHGEEDATSNLVTEALREDEPRGCDGDPHSVSGGMVPISPRDHLQSRGLASMRSNTSLRAVA